MTKEQADALLNDIECRPAVSYATPEAVPAAGGSSPVTGSEARPQTLHRPTAAGWWWYRYQLSSWSPQLVTALDDGRLYCPSLAMWDGKNKCAHWVGEWAGPLVPPAPHNK